jgi:sterol desaturase/sphingolipid hydroxylase (fatty acid hydroxylase superfamily)
MAQLGAYLSSYLAWLVIISVLFVSLERAFAWRRDQPVLRRGWLRDLGFLAINGHVFSVVVAPFNVWFGKVAAGSLPIARWAGEGVISQWGFLAQFLTLLVVADFIQWCVHNLLHRIPFLWTFHKVHHSLTIMDWIGNFHFHWMEIVVYRSVLAIPLAYVGASSEVILVLAVVSTFWGDFNHSNLNVSLGRLGYLLNNPRMHLWHHDQSSEGGVAKNFGIILSVWDFVFRTAYWPRDRNPEHLGYPMMDDMPSSLPGQLLWPLLPRRTPTP